MAAGGLFGAVEAQYEALSSRDRKLLAGLLFFFSILFVGVLLFTLNGWLDDRAASIQDKKDKLRDLQALQAEYVQAASIIEGAEERLARYEGTSVSAFLEKIAREAEVTDDLSVSQQSTENTGTVEQTRYQAELRRVGLDRAVAFLYDVETSGYPLSIDQARFKTYFVSGERRITLTLDAVHYRILEEEG